MSRHELLIGCVGKPSAGKSSFLNASTDAQAKIGALQSKSSNTLFFAIFS
jgi:GTPase involved in cell partitioning and DNA repair